MSETITLVRSRPFSPAILAKFSGGIILAVLLFFLVLPTLIVIPMSFGSASYIEFPLPGLP